MRRAYYEIEGGPADVAYRFPKQEDPYRLLAVQCSFLSPTATGNTRVPMLQISHGGLQLVAELPGSSQSDGGEQTVTWAPGLEVAQIGGTGHTSTTSPLPTEVLISPNDAVDLQLFAGDAGDTVGRIGFVIEFFR